MSSELVTLTAAEIDAMAAHSAFIQRLRPTWSAAETRQRLADVPFWYHTMYLGHGLLARGSRDTIALLPSLQLPSSLSGKTVLDIGSAEGFFGFECEARGAARVVAVDLPPPRSRRVTQERLKDLFASTVELVEGDVEEPDVLTGLTADVVLFLGVLYHLQNPFLALCRLRQITRQALYVESHVVNAGMPKLPPFGEEEPPIAVFYERSELAGDPSNWWGPNVSCLRGMLRAAGFSRVEVLMHTGQGDWHGRAALRAEP